MKFIKNISILSVIFLLLSLSNVHAELNLTDEQKAVLQIIHQLSWSAQKIYTYNDIIALDEEQETLSSDKLDLKKFIYDTENADLYKEVKNLRDYIFTFKESEEEKKALEEFRRDEQIIEIMENVNLFKGVVSKSKMSFGDPYTELAAMGSKLLINIGEGVSNYFLIRKKLDLKLKKEKYELDKKKRKILHESLQSFDEAIKKAIVKKLPQDKELRTPLDHIKRLVEAVQKGKVQYIPANITKDNINEINNKEAKEALEATEKLLEFLHVNEHYYRYFPMYWYYRGVCEEKLGNDKEAINAYGQYQKLDIGLIKWNKISASVAMNMTKLLLANNEKNEEYIYSQLQIIDSNTNIDKDDWNLAYFAGLVYLYKFEDIAEAKKELERAKEKLNRVYQEEWNKFKKKLEKEIEIEIPAHNPEDEMNICETPKDIPAGQSLYLCRLALNNAKIMETEGNQKESIELISELAKIANEETTSIFEGLNYFGSTGSNIFIEKYLMELASIRIAVNYECGTDELIAILPLKCFLLKEIYPKLFIYTFNEFSQKYEFSKIKCLEFEEEVESKRNNGTIEKKIIKNYKNKTGLYDRYEDRELTVGQKVKLFYDVEVDHMEDAKVEILELRIPHGNEQYISVLFDIDDLFNKNMVDPFMFARAVIYDGKFYKLFGNVIATNPDDTFEEYSGGGVLIDDCNEWRLLSPKWWGDLCIVDSLNRIRISFPTNNLVAVKLKDKHWNDIKSQLINDNYWKEYLEHNPPSPISEDNKDKIIHEYFKKIIIRPNKGH